MGAKEIEDLDCVEELALQILGHMKEGKTSQEICEIFKDEDSDLVGEAYVEAQHRQFIAQHLESGSSQPDPFA